MNEQTHKSGRKWEVRSFYAQDVAHPKEPGGLAIRTWHMTDHSKDMEVDVSLARKDFGRTEVRNMHAGGPWEEAKR